MYRWVVASDAEAAQKIAEEKFPAKVKRLSQVGSFPLAYQAFRRCCLGQISKLAKRLLQGCAACRSQFVPSCTLDGAVQTLWPSTLVDPPLKLEVQ